MLSRKDNIVLQELTQALCSLASRAVETGELYFATRMMRVATDMEWTSERRVKEQ
jgi:hypothetical protein